MRWIPDAARSGGPFLENPGNVWSRLIYIYRSKNGEVYIRLNSCIKRNSVKIKNVRIKPLCNREVLLWLYDPKREFPGISRNGHQTPVRLDRVWWKRARACNACGLGHGT